MASVLLIICALFLFLPLAKQKSIDKDLQSVLNAVENIIDFYQEDYKNLNVDGLFGLRVLEGHLGALIKKHGSGELQHLDTGMVTKLKEMKEKATRTCDQSLVHVKRDGERYFNQMSYVVNNPWNIFDSHRRKVNISYAWSKTTYMTAKRTVSVDEEISDKCMSELIGSHKLHGEPCDISSKCAYTMTAPGLLGYGITHQILWTMLADKAGCTEKLQARLFELGRGDITTLRLELCTNNYIQLKETVKKFPEGLVPGVQDLFLEQMFVCPSLGYVEFLDLNLLSQILSWQSKNGCYGKMRRTKIKFNLDPEITGGFEDDYIDEEEDNTVDTFKKEINASADNLKYRKYFGNRKSQNQNEAVGEMHANKGRKLLVEKSMSGGCLAHKTAVASGALIMYLRYLCEPDAGEVFSIKHKLGAAEPPPLDGGKKEIIHQLDKRHGAAGGGAALKHERVLGGGQAVNNNGDGGVIDKNNMNLNLGNDLAAGQQLHLDGDGGIEKLNMNLNKENELVNPLDRFNKFNNAFEEIKNKSKMIRVGDMEKDLNLVPKLMDKAGDLKVARDSNKLSLNNKLDPNKDDENYDYKYDDDNNEDDNDEDEYDDDDDEFNDYPNYDKRSDRIDPNMNQYYDDNDKDDDLKPVEGDDVNDKNPDNDDDYNADDGYNDGYDDNDRENVHPHINARNIGKSPDYDREGFENEDNRLKMVKDYDDDEDDGDDYEYDDKNDAMEERKEEETKNDFILAKPNKKVKESRQPVMTGDVHISEPSMLSTTNFVIFAISLVVLIILYRFIRKRRIRLRMGHKYFHV